LELLYREKRKFSKVKMGNLTAKKKAYKNYSLPLLQFFNIIIKRFYFFAIAKTVFKATTIVAGTNNVTNACNIDPM